MRVPEHALLLPELLHRAPVRRARGRESSQALGGEAEARFSRRFVGLVDFGADTLLQCFVADEEMLPEGRRYAGDALRLHVDAHGAPGAAAAARDGADAAPEAELPDAQRDRSVV